MAVDDAADRALQEAVRSGAVNSVFQPIVMGHGVVVGFEALARFPNGAAPEAVWKAAHLRDQVMTLDRLALERAICGGRRLPGWLFVNISASHLATLAGSLAVVGCRRTVWEVTESSVQRGLGERGADQIRAAGHRLALDDAGSGASTFDRLGWLRPDVVKLDQTVVWEWVAGRPRRLRRWVAAAHAAGAWVIAEGVEDAEWLVGLRAEGVEAFQGFAVGRPKSAAQAEGIARVAEITPLPGGGVIFTTWPRRWEPSSRDHAPVTEGRGPADVREGRHGRRRGARERAIMEARQPGAGPGQRKTFGAGRSVM